MAARSRREVMAKVEIMKQCYVRDLFVYFNSSPKTTDQYYLCFSSAKFKISLCSNKLFRCIFCSDRKFYALYNRKRPSKVFCPKLAC